MLVQVKNKVVKDIHKTPILQQTAFWSELKRKQGLDSMAFDIKTKTSDIGTSSDCPDYISDDLLVLLQDIGDNYIIGYVPYGPTIKPSAEKQGLFLEELSESLRRYLPSNCVLLRYDLMWESLWAKDDSYFDDHGHWIGPPAKLSQEIRLNFDTQKWNLKKANTNILPSDTTFIDLKKDDTQLLKEMKPKTRYNVKLSRRKGVHVRRADSDALDRWYDLYTETCLRNHIGLHDKAYFQTVFAAEANDTKSPANVELLIAQHDGKPLAAMFLAFSDKRATYLYGASSSVSRHYMATYALQWEAIQRAKKVGCTEYDMFGVSPRPDPSHPRYGLYRFKTGFGGRLFHRMGCWDYPLNPCTYDM